MKTHLNLMILALALLNGCGNDNQDRDDKTGEETSPTTDPTAVKDDGALLVDDEDAANQAVTAQIDDAISAAVEDNENATTAALTDASGDGKLTLFRECKEDGDKAVVEIRREAERTVSVEGPARKADSIFSAYYEKQRTWSKEGEAIKCGPAKKFADLDVTTMKGVQLDVTFKHQRARKTTLVNKVKGVTKEKSFSYSAEGTRHFNWTDVTEDTNYFVHKEVTGTSTRKLVIQKKDGTTTTQEATVTSAEGAPLVVVIERDHTTKAWLSRTIESGKRIATGNDGGRVELTFDHVKYTAEKRCTAVSGTISGSIFKKDETTAAATFTITFDGEDKSVSLSNGKEFDYSPDGCDLDEPTTAVDAATADEVKPAA